MYSQCTLDSADRIDTVKRILTANERLRELLFGDSDLTNDSGIVELREEFPPQSRWRIFEHCAAVTRLYAILEQCVGELVRAWLDDLPSVVPDYPSLGSSFEGAHRRGVAWVLQNIDHNRNKHLLSETICREFADAVSGIPKFKILPEAFLHENKTLKMDRISELLAWLCIQDGWVWLSSHGAVTRYLQVTRGGETTCEAELRTFISYRNDAAHGSPNEVLGFGPLMDCAEFISVLCEALCEQFDWNRVHLLKQHKSYQPLGTVTEVFQRSRAVIALISNATISVGQSVAIVGPRLYKESPIISIQDNDESIQTVAIDGEQELGLQFDWLPPKNCELFSLESVESAVDYDI